MAKRKASSKGSGEVGPVLERIVAMTDQFCREKLNEEYAILCRRLAEKLARKRPSPLLGGKPETWACGIIRTIGWVNFLDDSSNKPHMKLTAIDKAFGVAESTGQGKSKTIRTMLGSEELVRGFVTGVMNSRGPVWRGVEDGGGSERKLADHYRRLAQSARRTSAKLAGAFLQLADIYERHANEEDEEAERGRLGKW